MYVINNLGSGSSQTFANINVIDRSRLAAVQQLLMLYWAPEKAYDKILMEKLKNVRRELHTEIKTEMKAVIAVSVKRMTLHFNEVKTALTKHVQKQWDALQKEQDRLDQLFRELCAESTTALKEKLNDDDPLLRWVAIQVVSRKRLHLEGALVELVGDPNLQVREAARQALVRLSRGNDFGPPPRATPAQVVEARHAWRAWLRLQDPPTPTGEPLAEPIRTGSGSLPPRK